MVPIIELRGGIPLGVAQGLPYHIAIIAAIIGNIKGQKVRKYQFWGLVLFVGIPLPGTGAWTGALIASFLDIRLKNCILPIFLGVLMAATIITMLTFGVSSFI